MNIKLPAGKFARSKRGFTLIEILVAMAISAALSLGITMTIFQVMNVNASSNAHLQAVAQVQNAIHYLNRDVQMAQSVQPQGTSGFPLTLKWTSWSNNDSNQVIYSLSGNTLVRQFLLIPSDGGPASTTSLTVAKYLTETQCSYDSAAHKLTATITASTSSGSKLAAETRQVEIIPRPGS
jgi:prepilin-type N-terminal cleavage/methylation domain-containing protein